MVSHLAIPVLKQNEISLFYTSFKKLKNIKMLKYDVRVSLLGECKYNYVNTFKKT